MSENTAPLELGAAIGQLQAFGLIGNKCSATQSQLLRDIRQSGAYESLGLTWDEFCARHIGFTSRHVDDIICRLDEFGEDYFKLAQIITVSPDFFRHVVPRIHQGDLEINGCPVPIEPENGAIIRAEVLRLRAELNSTRTALKRHAGTPLDRLDCSLHRAFDRVTHACRKLDDAAGRDRVRLLIHDSRRRLDEIEKALDA